MRARSRSAVRRATSRTSGRSAQAEDTDSLAGMPACLGPATVVFDPTLTEYDFGPSHPMSPVRVDLTIRLAADLGVFDLLRTVPAPMASDELIATVHEPTMIAAVRQAGADPAGFAPSHGLGTDDNPVFPDMHR